MGGTLGVIGGSLLGGNPIVPVSHGGNVTVTAHATPHAKGAWTQIIDSTAADSTMLVLDVTSLGTTGTSTATLIDLAIGGSGSEVAFLSDLPCSGARGSATVVTCWQVPIPISIPAGSRISARIQSEVTAKTAIVSVNLFSGGSYTPGSSLIVLGADTGTSRGTSLGTSWSELTASLASTCLWLIPVPSLAASSMDTSTGDVVIGKGAASSETEIGRMAAGTNSSEMVSAPAGYVPWVATAIQNGAPAGSRIVAKRETIAAIDCAVIGVVV